MIGCWYSRDDRYQKPPTKGIAMSDTLKAVEYKGYTIKICHDDDPMNPRTEFDNITKMVCFHKKYNLGDKQDTYNMGDYNSWQELHDAICKNEKPALILPLYLYDHSGITISTKPFGCQWDSGQVGFVYITKEDAKKELGIKRFVNSAMEKVSNAIKSDVENYDSYLTGEVYGYSVEDKEGNDIESCWGYFGNYDDNSYIMTQAKSIVDNLCKKEVAGVILE